MHILTFFIIRGIFDYNRLQPVIIDWLIGIVDYPVPHNQKIIIDYTFYVHNPTSYRSPPDPRVAEPPIDETLQSRTEHLRITNCRIYKLQQFV